MILRHKFNAKPTTVDDIRFSSKREAAYYQNLCQAKKSGQLLFFLRQVGFALPGGVTYRCDFLEFWANGEVRFVDVKGMKTPMYILKKKQVESLYPVQIVEA
jgi:hypothetical protein